MSSAENTLFQYVNGDKMRDVYQSPDAMLMHELHQQSIPDYQVNPSSYSQQRTDYLYQQGKNYMCLHHRKRETFDVQIADLITAPIYTGPVITTAGTCPYLLTYANFAVDSFALSKMTTDISIKFGESELYTLNNGVERNVILQEIQSSMLDVDACRSYGQEPLLQSGVGALCNVVTRGFINRDDETDMNAASIGSLVSYSFTSEALSQKIQQKWIEGASGQRWRIVGIPVFNDATNLATTLYAGVGVTGDWQAFTDVARTLPFYGKLLGTYRIEIEEDILESFLKTRYHKNKLIRSVNIHPNNYVTIRYNYNQTYVKNGMFKSNTANTEAGDVLATPAYTYMNVTYQPDLSKLYLTSFDVLEAPLNFNYKLLTYEPHRMQANPPTVTLATTPRNTSVDNVSSEINIIDQTSSILGQVYLIASDPELYNGQQTAAIRLAGYGLPNFSTFLPFSPVDMRIWVDQTEITSDISTTGDKQEMLIEHTLDIMRNRKEFQHLLRGYESYLESNIAYLARKTRKVPFLLIDLTRLNTQNSRYKQFLANILYLEIKTVRFQFKLQSHEIAYAGYIAGNTGLSLTHYIHAYKFYPYLYIQLPAKPIKKLQVYNTSENALIALSSPNYTPRHIDLDMVMGGSWMSDMRDLAKKYGNELMQGLMKGVRLGENLTSNKPEFERANRVFKSASALGSAFGYGK